MEGKEERKREVKEREGGKEGKRIDGGRRYEASYFIHTQLRM